LLVVVATSIVQSIFGMDVLAALRLYSALPVMKLIIKNLCRTGEKK